MFGIESIIGSRAVAEAALGADGLVLVDVLAHILAKRVEVDLGRTNFSLALRRNLKKRFRILDK